MKNVTGIFTILLLLSPTALFSQREPQLQERLLRITDATWAAVEKSDSERLNRLFASNFLYVGAEGVLSAPELGKATQSCQLLSYHLSGAQVQILNASAAVLTYTAEQDFHCGKTRQPTKLYAADVYEKKKGRWLVAAHSEVSANGT